MRMFILIMNLDATASHPITGITPACKHIQPVRPAQSLRTIQDGNTTHFCHDCMNVAQLNRIAMKHENCVLT